MITPSHDTTTAEPLDFAPVTGEHQLRPPVALDTDPPESVPSWEPEDGDFS